MGSSLSLWASLAGCHETWRNQWLRQAWKPKQKGYCGVILRGSSSQKAGAGGPETLLSNNCPGKPLLLVHGPYLIKQRDHRLMVPQFSAQWNHLGSFKNC